MKYYCDNKRHLVCLPFSVENLHKMAVELKINKCWFHRGKNPHYDIPKRRENEIKLKCEVVTTRQIWQIINKLCTYNIV